MIYMLLLIAKTTRGLVALSDMLGLLTALEGAGSRPGDRALLVPARWP